MTSTGAEQTRTAVRIGVGAVSEVGQREQNQDCMTGFSSPLGPVYVVADGMGGHRGGAEASRMVAEAFTRHLMNIPASSPPRDAMTLAVRLANLEVLEKSRSGNPDFEGMGSTIVIALLRETEKGLQLTTAHVGDSRVYLHRGKILTQLTKDHTQVQWLIDNQALDETAARQHPDASVLTRAVGHTTDLRVDISDPIPLQNGDGILLCSDGLSGFVTKDDIEQTIQRNPDPSNCAKELVQLALAAGSNDNITVQILRIGQNGIGSQPGLKGTTEPEGKLPTEKWAQIPARYSRMAPVVVGLLIIAAIAGWLIYRPKPSPPVDAQIKSLDDRLQKLSARANTVQDGFTQGESQVDNDIKEVTNADKQRAHPQASTISLLKDLKELKGKFHEMASGDPYQLRALLKNDHKQSLDAIRKEAPGKPREDHEAKLSNALTKLDDDLRHQEDALSKLQNQKKELEAKVADVVKPVSAPPARAAAHAGDRPTEK